MENVLPALKAWRKVGRKTALATLVRINGSSPRPLGSQMAVADSGEAAGLITGGCAEAAIIAEARAAIEAGENLCIRYGAGSPYMDIRLPCGSGIDVFFDVSMADEKLDALLAAQSARRRALLHFDLEGLATRVSADWDEVNSGGYVKRYDPVVRVLAIGKGFIVPFVAQMAAAAQCEAHVYSPEQETLTLAQSACTRITHLTHDRQFDPSIIDAATAVLLLFHEHEWEAHFLEAALRSDCFYIGALGSRRTHADRLALMRERGIDEASLARIRGPVGLDIGAKSPPEIAISILAEIIETYRARVAT